MTIYKYTAKMVSGKCQNGLVDMENKEDVDKYLREKNMYPVSITDFVWKEKFGILRFSHVDLKEISVFCRQFSIIISSGISIANGLAIVKQQIQNKNLKYILDQVYKEVEKGKDLSEAMSMHKEFPNMLLHMVKIGEATGTLPIVLGNMADFYNKQYKQKQKIKQALTYPSIVAFVSVGVILFLIIKIVPLFADMFEKLQAGTLPASTRVLMFISGVMTNYWYIIVGVLLVMVIFLEKFYKSRSTSYKHDMNKLKWPIYGGLNKRILTSRFASTLGILIGSGISIIDSFIIAEQVIDNLVIKKAIHESAEEIKKGEGIADSLKNKNLFPDMLIEMIKIGEESGNLKELLQETAGFYDNDVETTIARITTMIEPAIVIVLGVIIGFIILSVLVPMLRMYSAAGAA